MNTKPIPIIMSLAAAFVSCLISISQKVDFTTFLARLLLSIFLFYFVGIVVGIFLLNAFGPPRPDGDDDIFDNEIEQEDEEAGDDENEDGENEDGDNEESDESSDEQQDTSDEAFRESGFMDSDSEAMSVPVDEVLQENIEDENIAGSVNL